MKKPPLQSRHDGSLGTRETGNQFTVARRINITNGSKLLLERTELKPNYPTNFAKICHLDCYKLASCVAFRLSLIFKKDEFTAT